MEAGCWEVFVVVAVLFGGVFGYDASPTDDPATPFRIAIAGAIVAFLVLAFPQAHDVATKFALTGMAVCFGAASIIFGRRTEYRDPNALNSLLAVCAAVAIVVSVLACIVYDIDPGSFTLTQVRLFLAIAALLSGAGLALHAKHPKTGNEYREVV